MAVLSPPTTSMSELIFHASIYSHVCDLALGAAENADLSSFMRAGLYALVCAAATLAGVFRSAISLVVLVVEGTRSINFLFGIITAVVVANWFANLFQQHGVYESELERDGNVYFLRHDAPRKLSTITAAEIMVPRPISFLMITPVKDVLHVLESTTHHGFPVVGKFEAEGAEGVGQLVGLVLRSQLIVLLKERCVWVLHRAASIRLSAKD